MSDRRQNTSAYYEARIAELASIVDLLSIDPAYGCLTKPGLVRALSVLDVSDQVVVYFDIDNFKTMNSHLGKAHCNAVIAKCIQPRGYDIIGRSKPLVGRWFSGDELVGIFPANDANGYAERVQRALHSYNASATFVLVPANYMATVFATIDFAELVNASIKKLGKRDLICDVRL